MIYPPPTSYMTPDEITAWRHGLNLSKREASVLLGCSRNSFYAYETGRRPIPRKLVLAMQAVAAMKAAA